MTTPASTRLFPLPLTPFEHYMLADDRPDYPMTGVLEYHFRGSLQPAAFQAAVAESLRHHPLLTAHVARRWFGRPQWVAPATEPTPVDWGPWEAPIRFPSGEGIDLSRENGLRVMVRQGGNRVRILTQVHHASTDALGVMRFFGDVLAQYARRVNPDGPCPAAEAVDAACLLRRGAPRWGESPEPVSWWESWRARFHATLHWLSRRPTPLALPNPGPPPAAHDVPDYPSIQYHTFSPAATAALRQTAHQAGGTLNDLLLRDLFLTLAEWNLRHARGRPGRWLSINMPTSLRQPADAPMPAANVLSYAFLVRARETCQDPGSLLAGIQRDTQAIKRWNLGMLFLEGLATAQRVPGLLRLSCLGQRCFATAVLTNLGDPSRSFAVPFPQVDGALSIGGLRLERLIAAPPLRPKTRAVFCLTGHAGCLTVSVRGDPNSLPPADTQRLLRAYVRTVCCQAGLPADDATASPGDDPSKLA